VTARRAVLGRGAAATPPTIFMQTVTLARNAMATRFEIVLHGGDPARLRAAGEEALDEIERLEAQLSLYRPTSEIARVNAWAATQPVRVSPGVFRLLQQARDLSRECGGAFDITVAPLVRCWGFMGQGGRTPTDDEIDAARAKVGVTHLLLDEAASTVAFDVEGAMLDLGAIGKGYAIDRAVEILRDAGVPNALLHGGTSTAFGIGSAPEGQPWKVAVEYPPDNTVLATFELHDSALSVSAVWGRSSIADGKTFGHILDPRTGRPAEAPQGAALAAVALPSATETDAFSTALLVLGEANRALIEVLRPDLKTVVRKH